MKFRHGWLLNTAAIAMIVWMTSNAAFAQIAPQNSAGNSALKVDCNKHGSINSALAIPAYAVSAPRRSTSKSLNRRVERIGETSCKFAPARLPVLLVRGILARSWE
jgi:hypothetical protein